MRLSHILLTLFIITLFSGCSSRSKGFFEDIYSQTEVRSATQEDYSAISASEDTPILAETQREKKLKTREKVEREYEIKATDSYHATGKIVDAAYDRDVNLYVYSFVKSGTSNPISFYYDKDLNPIGGIVTITIKENFLIDISSNDSRNNRIENTNNSEESQRTGKKRKRSRIKIPYVEKINTL